MIVSGAPLRVTPRALLVAALVLGVLGTVGALLNGTVAYDLGQLISGDNKFRAGVVDLAGNPSLPCTPGVPVPTASPTLTPFPTGIPSPTATATPTPNPAATATPPGFGLPPSDCTRGTASTLTASAKFGWTTAGGGTDCANARDGVLTTREKGQALAPGAYCVAPITIRNTSNRAIDGWLRFRLFRMTSPGGTGSAVEALNDQMRLYVHEYAGGTVSWQNPSTQQYNQGTTEQARDLDCTTATYRPSIFSSAAVITTDNGTEVKTRVPAAPNGVLRTALTSLGDTGRRIGTGGLGIVSGPNAAPRGVTGNATPAVTTGNVVTTLGATRNAFNIVGSDEINDPVFGASHTNANGTQAEALIKGGEVKLYCVAIFLPDDTGLQPTPGLSLVDANTLGDNRLALGSVAYYLTVDAAQRDGR